ncbi:MAG: M3 family oligoendopeptidase [Sumerlaeia bacterium]
MTALPNHANWDLTPYFPSFDGPEFRAHREHLIASLKQLGDDARALGSLTVENADAWADLYLRDETIGANYSHIASYIGCLCSDDARNEAYKAEQGRLAQIGAIAKKAMVPFEAALRDCSDEAFQALASNPKVADSRYALQRDRTRARYSMGPELETLAADLSVDGFGAWGRLYNNIAGTLEFEMRWPDSRVEMVPMAQKRSLMEDSDPAVRKAALVGSNLAWEKVETPVAACLNGIAGTRLTLNRYRGVEHFLDVAAFQSAVDKETIETMFATIADNRPMIHDYLRKKAKLIGKDKLGFQDLSCPLPASGDTRYSWPQGTAMVLQAFDSFYPALGQFTRQMLDKRRVESEKRPGKRPGAFCTGSLKIRESRVFMTYGGSLGDISTLAHELGHAFHSYVMRDLRVLQRSYPMTLAETASTFAESILNNAIIADESTPQPLRLQLLNAVLDDAATFLLDIHMRYTFEKALYTERAEGEVSVSRLKAMMIEAQREVFGDILAEDEMDPMFWASKLHFYITGVTFYNFPYTFGYLFSRGLFALAKKEGPSFLPRYEELLRLTGNDTAENVALRSIGADLKGREFWQGAIDTIREDLARFEELAGN